jgi:hypothetical protein
MFTLGGRAGSYGQGVSGAMESRAAVFQSQPQDVEVYRNGAWWPGSLLGWRHDVDGGCQVWVRLAPGGAEETTWTALDLLRLPEPEPVAQPTRHLSVVDAPAERSGDPALTATMTALRAVPTPAARRAGGSPDPSQITATVSLFAVRDHDEEAQTVVPAPRPGGRRRAPDRVDGAAVTVDRPAAVASASGRHRAPAPGGAASGRHRAADTAVRPAVRPDEAPAASRGTTPARPDESDAHPLTRPMRLDDISGRVPQPRRALLDGRLTGR